MREELRDSERLEHIIGAIDNIFEFVEGVTFDEYCSNKMMRFAVVKNLEIVGEAANNLTNELKALHTEVDWEKIIAMRPLLERDYYHISDEEIWSTIFNDLPQLKEQINRIKKSKID